MRIKVTHSIGDLASDLRKIPLMAAKDTRAAIRHGAMTGNLVAKESAKRTAGTHGKHYHRAFTWDQPRHSLFASTGALSGWSAEYGPIRGRRQGDMAFEEGPGPQSTPHHDLENSRAHAIGVVAQDVRKAMDGWFWPA